MQPVEASVVVPLSPEETWDFIWDDPRRAVEHFDDILAVEDYQMRDDGTPRYRMVRKFGPLPPMSFVSDYFVFERPHRHVNRTLESPFGGNFYGTYEPTAGGGTRATWRWEIEPQNTLVGLLLAVMRPLLAWSLQRDLNTYAKAATARGDQQPREDQQRQVAASGTGLLGGGVVAAIILAPYLVLRRRGVQAEEDGAIEAALSREVSFVGHPLSGSAVSSPRARNR